MKHCPHQLEVILFPYIFLYLYLDREIIEIYMLLIRRPDLLEKLLRVS